MPNETLGSVARQIHNLMTATGSAAPQAQQRILDGARELELNAARESLAVAEARLTGGGRAALFAQMEEYEKHHKTFLERRRAQELDLDTRHVPLIMRTWRLSRTPHLLLLLLIGSLDFAIFQQSFAIALEVEDSWRAWEYWQGGLFGLLVFLSGVMLGHLAKDWVFARRAVESGAKVSGEWSRPSLGGGSLVLLALLYLALTFCAGAVRYYGQFGPATTARLAATALTVLIPVLGAAVEYFSHDPLLNELRLRPPFSWGRRAWLNVLRRRLESLRKAQTHQIALIEKRYEVERGILDQLNSTRWTPSETA